MWKLLKRRRCLLLSERVRRLLCADFRAAVEGLSLLRAAVNHRGEPGQFAASCASPEPKLQEQLLRDPLSLSLPLSLARSLSPLPTLSLISYSLSHTYYFSFSTLTLSPFFSPSTSPATLFLCFPSLQVGFCVSSRVSLFFLFSSVQFKWSLLTVQISYGHMATCESLSCVCVCLPEQQI